MQPIRRLLPWFLCPALAILLCLFAFQLHHRPAAHDPLLHASGSDSGSGSSVVSCREVPTFDQVWEGFETDSRSLEAAVYTPYHITPGGGEKYLLSVVQALQYSGFHVNIYTSSDNACRTTRDLMATASALRVRLDQEKLTFQFWDKHPPRIHPRVFFALGNGKFPIKRNIGQLGFYMCQFPFDLDRAPDSQEDVAALGTYDHILVNSRFTFGWYNHYTSPTFSFFRMDMQLMPSVDILHPPCAMLSFDPAAPRNSIVMLGRFFSGRQNKGHAHAIKLFAKLAGRLPTDTRLVLVGQLAKGHEEYVLELHELVRKLPAIASRVDFNISVPPEAVAQLLGSSLVQWHMTGLEVEPDKDPASREHFGISIVESMSAGSIPIALATGGPADIIQHGVDGFLAASEADFRRHTLHVFGSAPAALAAMRAAAAEKAKAFSYESFERNFLGYVHRGLLTRPYRYFVSRTLPTLRACAQPAAAAAAAAPTAPMAAMIVEGRNHYALEYTLYNVMGVLGKSSGSWVLHVYHSEVNRRLVQQVVAGARGGALRAARLHELPAASLLDAANLTALMKSEALWKGLGSAKKVLVFEADSLMVNPGIERFLQYDFVAAPWHKQHERWAAITAHVPSGVGAGAFSLRSVPLMRDIARQYGRRPDPTEPEDLFFAQHVSKYHKLAPRAEAYDFCLEVPCDDLAQAPDGPVAVHAAWLYSPLPVVQRLLYRSLVSALCDDGCGDDGGPGGRQP